MSDPLPPQSKYNGGIRELWKISPSLVGGLLDQMTNYGMDYYSTLAYIWQRSQPAYFQQCLNYHGYIDFEGGIANTKQNFLELRLSPERGVMTKTKAAIKDQIDKAIRAVSTRQRLFFIANAISMVELGCLTRQEQSLPDEQRRELIDFFANEIRRRVYTESGTIGEEDDIINFFKRDGNFDNLLASGLGRGDKLFRGKPNYWNDNRGTSTYPTSNVKISHRPGFDEYFHHLIFETQTRAYGAIMWGKLDGVLYGLTMDANNNSHKYYDVFEAKQRQGASTMQYVNGKESEITQMQIYMMMLEGEKQEGKPEWRWGATSRWKQNPAPAERTGAWLLQTQWNTQNQTLRFVPWSDDEVNKINGVISRALNDLWKIQIYKHRQGTDLYNEGVELQRQILESVGWAKRTI